MPPYGGGIRPGPGGRRGDVRRSRPRLVHGHDLDVSERFYVGLFGFVPVLDVGYGRILMHPAIGFTLSVMRHEGAAGGRFTELTTGLDHLGLTAASRAELEEWERRFDEFGVTYTPIRDMEFGFHLNFRDPDGIALELSAPNEILLAARQALAAGQTGQDDIDAFIADHDLDLPSVAPADPAGSG